VRGQRDRERVGKDRMRDGLSSFAYLLHYLNNAKEFLLYPALSPSLSSLLPSCSAYANDHILFRCLNYTDLTLARTCKREETLTPTIRPFVN